jgi:hypothetical protein
LNLVLSLFGYITLTLIIDAPPVQESL